MESSTAAGAPPEPIDVKRLPLAVASDLAGLDGWGMSKMCTVDLSEVTASRWLEGENAKENIAA